MHTLTATHSTTPHAWSTTIRCAHGFYHRITGTITCAFMALHSLSARAAVKVPDSAGTLNDTETGFYDVMDIVVGAAIAVVFVVGIVGLVYAGSRIFGGRAGEGLATLLIGIASIVVIVGVIGVLATGYNTARS